MTAYNCFILWAVTIDYSIADNPFNEFHVNAKYVNSSAVAAEVFHVVNRVKVSDAMVAVRLNNSNLLHSRLYWRPTALVDLRVLSFLVNFI